MKALTLIFLFISTSVFATQDDYWWWGKMSYEKSLPMNLGILKLDIHLKSEFSEGEDNIQEMVFVLNSEKIQVPSNVLESFKGINPSSFSLSTSHIDEGFTVTDVIFTARFNYGYPDCVRRGSISISSTGYTSHMITGEQVCS
ncbi:hypothetical protein ACJJIG_17650 [Microbulbifer sp. SSSA007]|uniref:hypothetical protein n=1 Tax=Microbulbifer sp. SSSA007 TaxID=3243379 RepID=UPI00403A0A51